MTTTHDKISITKCLGVFLSAVSKPYTMFYDTYSLYSKLHLCSGFLLVETYPDFFFTKIFVHCTNSHVISVLAKVVWNTLLLIHEHYPICNKVCWHFLDIKVIRKEWGIPNMARTWQIRITTFPQPYVTLVIVKSFYQIYSLLLL